jgi:hypothetical protein
VSWINHKLVSAGHGLERPRGGPAMSLAVMGWGTWSGATMGWVVEGPGRPWAGDPMGLGGHGLGKPGWAAGWAGLSCGRD